MHRRIHPRGLKRRRPDTKRSVFAGLLKRDHAFLAGLDLEGEIFGVDPTLGEAAFDEPEAGLAGSAVHVAQLKPVAKAPDRPDAIPDLSPE